jgi:hypothetical protein
MNPDYADTSGHRVGQGHISWCVFWPMYCGRCWGSCVKGQGWVMSRAKYLMKLLKLK